MGLLCVVLLDLRVQGDFQVFNAAHTKVVESTASLGKKSVLSKYLMPLPSLTSRHVDRISQVRESRSNWSFKFVSCFKFVSQGRT